MTFPEHNATGMTFFSFPPPSKCIPSPLLPRLFQRPWPPPLLNMLAASSTPDWAVP